MTSIDLLVIITTTAVILLTSFLCIALFHLVRILQRVNAFLDFADAKSRQGATLMRDVVLRIQTFQTALEAVLQGARFVSQIKKKHKRKGETKKEED